MCPRRPESDCRDHGLCRRGYRVRKRVTRGLMAQIAGAHAILHDFHFPLNSTQCARDRRFPLDTRWTITGPGRTE